jgi:hypothetical protein
MKDVRGQAKREREFYHREEGRRKAKATAAKEGQKTDFVPISKKPTK